MTLEGLLLDHVGKIDVVVAWNGHVRRHTLDQRLDGPACRAQLDVGAERRIVAAHDDGVDRFALAELSESFHLAQPVAEHGHPSQHQVGPADRPLVDEAEWWHPA